MSEGSLESSSILKLAIDMTACIVDYWNGYVFYYMMDELFNILNVME